MKITQVPVDKHPLLASLWGILVAPSVETLLASAVHLNDKRDVLADIEAGPDNPDTTPPLYVDPRQSARITAAARDCYWLRDVVGEARDKHPGILIRGAYYYPPGGGMGWHTNSDDPGWRAYVTWIDRPGGSFMGTRDGFIADLDAHANVFQIGPGKSVV